MDESLLLAINSMRAPWIDAIAAPLSTWGIYAFPLLMLVALVKSKSHARAIRDGWLTFFLSTFLTESVLKPIIGRPRPTAVERLREALDVMGRVPPSTSLAFPSGTATAAFAGATWIWLRWGWRPGAPATVLAMVISLSRIYGGIHWPSDIVGGAIVGAVAAIGLDRLAKRIERIEP